MGRGGRGGDAFGVKGLLRCFLFGRGGFFSLPTLFYGGAMWASRPTKGQGVRCAGRCRHRPLQPLIEALPRTCRAGCTPRAFVPLRSTGTHTPPSTYDSTTIDGGGMWALRPTTRPKAFCKPCRGRCPHRPVNIRQHSDRRGGMRASRPTRSQRVLIKNFQNNPPDVAHFRATSGDFSAISESWCGGVWVAALQGFDDLTAALS